MRSFIRYIIKYWTHYRPIEFKKETFLNKGWHYCSYYFKEEKGNIIFNDIVINKIERG